MPGEDAPDQFDLWRDCSERKLRDIFISHITLVSLNIEPFRYRIVRGAPTIQNVAQNSLVDLSNN